MRKAAFPLLLLAALGGGCERHGDAVHEQLQVFGSIADIEIRGVPRDQAEQDMAEASKLLRQREREWHAWQDSDLTRINAAIRAGRSAEAPDSVIALLQRSRQFAADSGGLLDPAVGGLVELWGFHTSTYPVTTPAPSLAQVEAWRRGRPTLRDVEVDGRRISSRNPYVQLDFNAIAEGAAASELVALFEKRGVRHALISLGGDVTALGDGDGEPWEVGMKDPYGGALGAVELVGPEAFFSSGNYNKFREAGNGGRWGHILDPRTGMPARGAAATAVLGRDPLLADAGSTALMVAGPAGFERVVRGMKLGCALMVTEENEVLMTRAMKQRMRFLREPVALGEPVDMGATCNP